MFERSHGMEWITTLIRSFNQSVPEQMFVSAYSMSGSVLEKNEADSASLTDLRLVDELCPPTIHHVRAEVVEARTVAVEREGRDTRDRELKWTEFSSSNPSLLS